MRTTTLLFTIAIILKRALLSDSQGVLPRGDEVDAQYHRSLGAFVLPFKLLWTIQIGNSFPGGDRQPTAAEYEGVRQATIAWFSKEIPVYYAGAPFTFVDFTATLNRTTWDTSLEYPHQILFHCQVIWNARTLSDLPTIYDFLSGTSTSANYPYRDFITQYLWNADPQSPRSIFQYTQGLGHTTNSFGTAGPLSGPITPAPVVTTGPVVTPAPVMPSAPATPITAAPVPEPSTPQPVAPTLPQRKVAPPEKCGSLATANGRGGAAAQAKACGSGGVVRRVKLKGSSRYLSLEG